jgi:hypothetical protein
MSMSPRKVLFSVGALVTLLGAASTARAQECATAADCGKGFTCEIVNIAPPPTKGVACAAGSVCPVADPGTAVDAGTATTGTCVEASCTSDADCGVTMVCHSEGQTCTGGGAACPTNAECFVPTTPPTCTPVSICKYEWELPCTADAECGDGFSCVFGTSGGCGSSGMGTVSGGMTSTGVTGAPTPASDGGAASRSAPAPGDCVVTTNTVGSCQPKATTCAVDADCPTAWTCVDAPPVRTLPAQAADAGTAIAMGAPAPMGGASSIAPGEPPPSGTTPAPTKVCRSPFGILSGVAVDANGAQVGMGGGMGGSAGTNKTGAAGSGGPGAPDPMAPNEHAAGGAPSSGCNVGGGARGASIVVSALALLGLVIARRRRSPL